ncbi:MAG: GNAT family N-acetyltransferase [Burkholderiales bacterium]|jgi:predicted GNAT family N-acyltransferase|nr:GNAT family N-acetyltransferase [Burkholderiales bacterium]
MSKSAHFTVRLASWSADGPMLQALRRAVFIVEQGVPEDMEWDEHDALSLHALAFDEHGAPVGTGRLLPDGHLGRMAVLRERRRQGAGRAVLEFLLAQARRRGMHSVRLHAQTHAMGFYARQGFIAEGGEFMEAGIPHRRMTLSW